jgi:hypothetical protein
MPPSKTLRACRRMECALCDWVVNEWVWQNQGRLLPIIVYSNRLYSPYGMCLVWLGEWMRQNLGRLLPITVDSNWLQSIIVDYCQCLMFRWSRAWRSRGWLFIIILPSHLTDLIPCSSVLREVIIGQMDKKCFIFRETRRFITVFTLKLYFFKMHFGIIIPWIRGSPKRALPYRFPNKNLTCICSLPSGSWVEASPLCMY